MAKKVEKNVKDKTSFSKRFKAELKKVVWPTPKQLLNNTVAVLVIVIVTALIVFALDLAFESLNKYGINKLKEDISNSSSNNVTENEETEDNAQNSEKNASESDETDNSKSSDENASAEETETTEENTNESANE